MEINLIIGIIGLVIAIIGVITAIIIGVIQIRVTRQPMNDVNASSSSRSALADMKGENSTYTRDTLNANINQEVNGDHNAVTISGDAVVNVTKK